MYSDAPSGEESTDRLIERASAGDADARAALLLHHEARLRRMVSYRMDPRMGPRIDPSDVVQEALLDAHRKLPEYLRTRPLPFYPWLRRIAWERLVNLQLKHIHAEKRSVRREAPDALGLSDRSAAALAMRLVASGTSPSGRVIRKEMMERVRRAMEELSERDREVLILRHLEQLSIDEIAAVLGMSAGAVKVCRLRALERLRARLADVSASGGSSRGVAP